MQEIIRAFIAIKLPDAVISSLGQLQQSIRKFGFHIRWVRPENIHLTLQFLGDVKVSQLSRIRFAMQAAAVECKPMTLNAKGVGVFPNLRRPRVLWAGISGAIQPLFAYRQRLTEELALLGFATEKKPFKAHVTLGRFKHGGDYQQLARVMKELGDYHSADFHVTESALFKSNLRKSGAVYTQLEKIVLGVRGGGNESNVVDTVVSEPI